MANYQDGRRVLLRFEPTRWERERFGDAQAAPRKLRMLADTVIRRIDTIQKVRET